MAQKRSLISIDLAGEGQPRGSGRKTVFELSKDPLPLKIVRKSSDWAIRDVISFPQARDD